MSATASAELFVNYFQAVGIQPSLINIPGRSYPVDIHWLSDCERMASSRVKDWSPKLGDATDDEPNKNNKNNNKSKESKYTLSPRAKAKIDNEFLRDLIRAIVKQQQSNGELQLADKGGRRETGTILLFMPGKQEINATRPVLPT